MFTVRDLLYFDILLIIGVVLGVLIGLGFSWQRVAISGVALFLAVLIVWWQREGKYK